MLNVILKDTLLYLGCHINTPLSMKKMIKNENRSFMHFGKNEKYLSAIPRGNLVFHELQTYCYYLS